MTGVIVVVNLEDGSAALLELGREDPQWNETQLVLKFEDKEVFEMNESGEWVDVV